ncbi:Oxygen-dependent coproporphyrinogen-III oxidase [Nymphon striatum]|nr:Oxygen-dependent coproporphyrinogen-III oxidase [Nymphon striatum]
MFWTPGAWWFGGGSDLNPCLERDEDTAFFHGVLKEYCDKHDAEYYPRFKEWADEYFYVPHRNRARGVGGIFYDDLNTGDWDADFAFTQDPAEFMGCEGHFAVSPAELDVRVVPFFVP